MNPLNVCLSKARVTFGEIGSSSFKSSSFALLAAVSLLLGASAVLFLVPFGGAVLLGDADGDGDVDIIDALQVARYDAGLNPSPFDEANADVDCDSDIDIIDALQIARHDAGLIGGFCA